jgi:hypothetical protein
MLSIYYLLPLLHGIVQPPDHGETILAKDKKAAPAAQTTTVAVATASARAPAGRVKITGNADERAAKIASHLEAGGSLEQIDVDKFTRLPDNITLTSQPITRPTDAQIEDQLNLNPLDIGNNHATDPIPPGTEGTFDPLAPEPFVPSDPLASVPEGQTPILEHRPYSQSSWGAMFSNTLIDRSNELANKVWPTSQSYVESRHGSVRMGFRERTEVMDVNRTFFDRYPLGIDLRRLLATETIYVPSGARNFTTDGYAFTQRANEVLAKLRRLEKKEGINEVIDDAAREKIIETVLMPTTSFGINSEYHGYNYLDLRFPHQKAVVNEVLSKEEVTVIEQLINYIPRLRILLAGYDQHVGAYNREDLMNPLAGNRPEARYSNLQEDRKLLQTIKKVLHFFEQAIPHNIVQDFLPELRHPRKSSERYLDLQRASKDLREASLGYIQETSSLSKMLEEIMDLSDALYAYFNSMVEEIAAVYTYLDRVGITLPQLLDESEARIRESEHPW